MTPRQARTERRAAERKAKKLALRAAQHSTPEIAAISDTGAHTTPELHQAPQSGPTPVNRVQMNRANAQKSTGPRTSAGKLASSRNSLQHGLASSRLIIQGEDPADFDVLLAGLLAEHQPATPTEELLVREMAQSWWLAQRALRLQNECFALNSLDEKRLSLFLRYQTTHERAFHKALNALIRFKKDRTHGFVSQMRLKAAPEPEFVSQNCAAAPQMELFYCEKPHASPEQQARVS